MTAPEAGRIGKTMSTDNRPAELAWADRRYTRRAAVQPRAEPLQRPDVEAYRAYVETTCPGLPAALAIVKVQGDFPPEVSSDPADNDEAFSTFEDRIVERVYVEAGKHGQSIVVSPRLWWWKVENAFHVGPNVRCLAVVLTAPWVAAPQPVMPGEGGEGSVSHP